jgi:hypothetical protein
MHNERSFTQDSANMYVINEESNERTDTINLSLNNGEQFTNKTPEHMDMSKLNILNKYHCLNKTEQQHGTRQYFS